MLAYTERINTKKELKEWLDAEISQYYKGIVRVIFPISERDIIVKHQILLRKTEYYLNNGRKLRYLIYRFRLLRLQRKYQLSIPLNCCKKGLKIMHLGSILMNNRVTVGENCVFHINTALVAGGVDDAVPQLDNGVIVGIGAIVLGGGIYSRKCSHWSWRCSEQKYY